MTKGILIGLLIGGGAVGSVWMTMYLLSLPSNSPKPYEKVTLSRFPFSLAKTFLVNNNSLREQNADYFRAGDLSYYYNFIIPYNTLFSGGHYPAIFKWYMGTGGERLEVSFGEDTWLEGGGAFDGEYVTINGVEYANDSGCLLYLNSYIMVIFGHITIRRDLRDAAAASTVKDINFGNSKGLFIPADTVIGLTNFDGAEMRILDLTHRNFDSPLMTNDVRWNWMHCVNPYDYCSKPVQEELRTHYDFLYEAKKVGGVYPFGHIMNSTFNVNQVSTLFGVWFYSSGPLVLNASHYEQDHPFGFNGAMLDILGVNQTDKNTFYKDEVTGLSFGSDMIGLFGDYYNFMPVTEHTPVGNRYMYLLSGDLKGGICNLTKYGWEGERPGPVYFRYLLDEGLTSDMFDDSLTIEYFDTYLDAQGGFTANKYTYNRDWYPNFLYS